MKAEDVKTTGNIKANDAEILANFKAQLESGRTFVHAISEPKANAAGESFFQLYLIQQQKTVNENVNELDVVALGWDKERITNVRSIRNIDVKQLSHPDVASWVGKGNFVTLAGKDVNIQREHTLEKPYATAEPIKSKNADGTWNVMCFVDEDGVETNKPVYQITKPVVGAVKNKFFRMTAVPETSFIGIDALAGQEAGSMENAEA
jgi:hypothetical protein